MAEFVRQAMLLRDVDRNRFYSVHTDPESEDGATLSLHDLEELVISASTAVPEALRSAADDLVLPGSSDRGYYSGYADSGYNEAEVHAEAWLKDRADKIEEGES